MTDKRRERDPSVLLQPAAGRAARRHYRETIKEPVPIARIRPYLSEEELKKIATHYPDGKLFIWGLTPGKRGQGKTKWEHISAKDIALFSWNNKFRACARVTEKIENPELARELWGTNDRGNTWQYVYFLTEPQECDIPYEEFNEVVGFKPNFVPQGFNVLDDEKSASVLRLLELPVDVDGSDIDPSPTTWWVNQGSTYRKHRELGIVWAPQEGQGGRTYRHHQNVAELKPGDRILHYSDKAVQAVGIVTGAPVMTETSPEDGRDRWNEEGYQAPVDYHSLEEPINRDDIPLEWRRKEGAPFTTAGELRQGYLYGLSEDFARKMAGRFPQIGEYFPSVPLVDPIFDLAAVCSDFSIKLRDAGLRFGDRHNAFVRDFVVSLATKQLIILTGLSGSGKTQIALQFGRWLGENRSKVVPVRPDWTGAEALFGYPDALQKPSEDGRRAWHVPEPLAFMLRAARDPERPYLMVLDEMNLAHVERYFADVISGMESGEGCLPNVRQEDGVWREVSEAEGPAKISFPNNLFIAGTVNVDETTYMFSPKVLDRANTMEIRVRTEDLSADIRRPGKCAPGNPSLVQGFLEIARDERWQREHPPNGKDEFVEALKGLHQSLDQAFSFGHRVLYEAVRFAALYEAAGGSSMGEALDTQVLQKILPRLHGSRRQLEPVLETVGKFCFDLAADSGDGRKGGFDPVDPPDGDPVLPRSFDKVQRMTERLRINQFVSFTE